MAHDWPGNVRELENLMLREFLLADDDMIRIEAAPREIANGAAGREHRNGTFKTAKAEAVAQFERAYLRRLLDETRGNISLAARISRKDRSTLNKLVKKHGLGERFRSGFALADRTPPWPAIPAGESHDEIG